MDFFVFDSDMPPRDSFFTGYAFSNGKFYISDELTNLDIPSGCDGAYVCCNVTEDKIHFGVDWMGAGRIFYYQSQSDRNYWAISNSLWLLIEKLSEKGKKLALDSDMVKISGYRGAFVQQMISESSIVSEIKLLSRWNDIVIPSSKNAGMRVVARALPSHYPDKNNKIIYKEALRSYTLEMLGRIKSLVNSGMRLTFDLTGGIDSRVTFSFASYLINREPDLKNNIVVYSSPKKHHENDFRIASIISLDSGMVISKKKDVSGRAPSKYDKLRYWELNRLGQYSLSRSIPPIFSYGNSVSISGAGGESYRPFYKKWSKDLDGLMRGRQHFLHFPRIDVDKVVENLRCNVEKLKPYYFSDTDDLITHYREFRGRLHMGIPASENLVLHLLSGSYMDALAEVAPRSYITSKQIYFDIIANLNEDLLNFEFDKPEKAPTEENIRNITLVDLESEKPEYKIERMQANINTNLVSKKPSPSKNEFLSIVESNYKSLPQEYSVCGSYVDDSIKMLLNQGHVNLQRQMPPLQYIYMISKLSELNLIQGGLRSWFLRKLSSFKSKFMS
ncbi:hypothetical protein ACJJIL_06490 [Microbulbifer sp. EKSA005]|uniref:hypothetical protein n=1 Tax=Microbulbifer sp. EKSA005 TaxID=3243364 RepID=UPI0040432231